MRLVLAVIIGFGLLTAVAVGVWGSSLTLWRQAAQVAPQSPRAVRNYAVELARAGRHAEAVALLSP